MILILITFLLIATSVYLLSIIIGTYTLKALKINSSDNDKSNYTIESFWGLFIIIVFYSIICTKGITIYLISAIPILTLYLSSRKNKRTTVNLDLKKILIVSLKFGVCFIIIFLLSLFWNYHQAYNNDITFYANIGKHLSNGKENYYHYFSDIITQKTTGTMPYHYFELWFQSIIEKITGEMSSAIVLKYLIYNYFKVYIILGVESILFHFKKSSYFNLLIIISISLIPFELFANFFVKDNPYHLSIWHRQNFLMYLFVLIPFYIFTLKKQYLNGIIVMMLIPLVSTVTAPSVFCFLPIYTILLLYFEGIKKKEALYYFLSIIIMALAIISFYKLFGLEIKSLKYSFDQLLDIYSTSWKGIIYYIVCLPLGLLSIILPLAIFIKASEGGNKQVYLLMLGGLIISFFGVVVFQLGFFIGDFYQFPFVGYSFIYLISITVLSMSAFSSIKLIKLISIIIIIIGLYFSKKHITIPESYNIIENNILLSQNKNTKVKLDLISTKLLVANKEKIKGRGFYILNLETLNSLTSSEKTFSYNQYANFLYYLNNSIQLIPLVFSKDLYSNSSSKNDEKYTKAHNFNDLLPPELFKNNLKDLNSLVKKYNINFLFVEGDNKIKICTYKFPDSEKLCLNENRAIFILNLN